MSLERRVTALEAEMRSVKEAVSDIRENTQHILDFLTSAKTAGALVQKHGPRVIAFGVGLLSAAGIGNPQVLAFVKAFFAL
jgi:hypothetical protein